MQSTVIMGIEINTIPLQDQRYKTAGDWYNTLKMTMVPPQEVLTISISELGNEEYEFLVAIHELVEAFLCRRRGIPHTLVDEFDLANPKQEPGDLPESPYFKEHQFASKIERLLAAELGVNWNSYEAHLAEVIK